MELKKTSRLIGAVFSLVGVLWLLLSLYLLKEGLQRKQFEANHSSESVQGIVVGYESRSSSSSKKSSGSSSTSYYPIYEYQYQESVYRYTSSSGGKKSNHPLGSTQTLLIFGGEHDSVREDSKTIAFFTYYGGGLMSVFALLFLYVGLSLLCGRVPFLGGVF